jgi:SAM-dependent methyltransferase
MEKLGDRVTPRFIGWWLIKKLKEKGFAGVADFAVSKAMDSFFDLYYGTSTSGRIPSRRLDTKSSNIRHSRKYQPTMSRPLKKLFETLSLPDGSVFVDLGSGKGKALLIASRYPAFKKVVGIEFAHDLCHIARKNVDAFIKTGAPVADIEIIESDVLHYKIHKEDNVFFLYNPFDDVILLQLLRNMQLSIKEHPRKVWLSYHTPVHREVIDRYCIFNESKSYFLGGVDFVVYENAGGTL